MGIDVAWVDERNAAMRNVFDPNQRLSRLAISEWSRSLTVCLRFVDACGDVVFNPCRHSS